MAYKSIFVTSMSICHKTFSHYNTGILARLIFKIKEFNFKTENIRIHYLYIVNEVIHLIDSSTFALYEPAHGKAQHGTPPETYREHIVKLVTSTEHKSVTDEKLSKRITDVGSHC